MGMRWRISGFTLIEILVGLSVISLVAASVVPMLIAHLNRNAFVETNNGAKVYITALHEYYWRYCNITPFPQPTVSSLQDLEILQTDIGLNPLSNSYYLPSVQNPQTNRAVAVVELTFPTFEAAIKAASFNRSAQVSGSTVVWRESLTQIRASSAFGAADTSIFSSTRCRGT
jgi:prepilin-type N-terminal cleavage/methylation domain-containing protein